MAIKILSDKHIIGSMLIANDQVNLLVLSHSKKVTPV